MNTIKIIKYPDRLKWFEILRGDKTSGNGIFAGANSTSASTNSIISSINDADSVRLTVTKILGDVEARGDKAVAEYAAKFDGVKLLSGASRNAGRSAGIRVSSSEISAASRKVPPALKKAIARAITNITKFHAAQKVKDITVETSEGVVCNQISVPIEKVGLYIPGGTAPLFSTVIMLAVPARLAGCKEIVMCTPATSPVVYYAAAKCGVTKIYRIGGAAAIGAMAFGTKTVPRVDKIFGPGNSYVTAAKQIIGGSICAIDMPAGPSEVMILADDYARADFVCADFMSQLEHGADSQAVLITTSAAMASAVASEFEEQLKLLNRKSYILSSAAKSKIIICRKREEMWEIANLYAPEHLIICTRKYAEVCSHIVNAGSIFLGNYTPESAGDYASGTNHTLPTGGWARGYNGVNLSSFTKRITVQEITKAGLKNLSSAITKMAEAEGLDAHKNAVEIRLK